MINTVKKKKKKNSVGIFFFVSKYEKQKKKNYITHAFVVRVCTKIEIKESIQTHICEVNDDEQLF